MKLSPNGGREDPSASASASADPPQHPEYRRHNKENLERARSGFEGWGKDTGGERKVVGEDGLKKQRTFRN